MGFGIRNGSTRRNEASGAKALQNEASAWVNLDAPVEYTGPARTTTKAFWSLVIIFLGAESQCMKLFDFLHLHIPELSSADCKLHMAQWNGVEHPLDVFFAGDFEGWQRWQKRRNFQRRYVVALIQMPDKDKWLFGGLYERKGVKLIKEEQRYHYDLEHVDACAELTGRLVIRFKKRTRQAYLLADQWDGELVVSELKRERLTLSEFPGFKSVNLSKRELDGVIRQKIPSWKGALSSVSGVYVISDTKSGKLYVGSAYGEAGIWGRWSQYSSSGHGNNVELRALLKELGAKSAEAFRFSILEVSDVHANKNEIIARESHWKDVLLSRVHGYNSN